MKNLVKRIVAVVLSSAMTVAAWTGLEGMSLKASAEGKEIITNGNFDNEDISSWFVALGSAQMQLTA